MLLIEPHRPYYGINNSVCKELAYAVHQEYLQYKLLVTDRGSSHDTAAVHQ